ncbi:short-chain dehydrogenase/reductase SDR [Elysia marginata]|uniref:Short-chain dehydrogenase/reductase SDR n=1 Tax=Elysia marginata TaxID=1093978 RepID=A0AAV4K4P6_9GAST|nr:short-chain dehydrogenase/reductase SDR [Elysia marginata]
MADFKDKTVIVTGSSSGIGESAAILFATRGANVTVCGRDELRLRHVMETCLKAGHDAGHANRVIAVAGDMSSADVRADTVRKTVEAFGQLDVLVANHGGQYFTASLNDVTEDNFDKNMDMNMKSVLFMIKESIPCLEQTGGSVIVTSSQASSLCGVANIAYHMGKAAVDHMVRCLSLELGPKGE